MIARTHKYIYAHPHTDPDTRSEVPTTGELQQVSDETRHITFYFLSRCVVLHPTAQEQIHVGYRSYI